MRASPPYDHAPVFVGGDGRSGTTLLSLILDSHPQLAVGPELHFRGPVNLGPYILRCIELRQLTPSDEQWAQLKQEPDLYPGVHFINRCHRFGVDHRRLRELIEQTMAGLGGTLETLPERCALVEAIGQCVRRSAGADRWGLKIMRDLRIIDRYAAVWPRAQFIHLVRDGRDVAASQLRDHDSWGYADIEQAAKGWVDLIRKTRKLAKPYQVMEVKYEDLVVNAERTVRRLLDFLGVCWDDRVLQHSRVDHSLFANPYHHPSIATVVNPINASAVGRYRRDLTAEQITSFNRIAGETLSEFGYGLS